MTFSDNVNDLVVEECVCVDVCLLAAYWYRDDSLALWDVIWKFVDAVLSLYYKDDVAVLSDGELAAMLAELRQQSLTSLVRTLLLLLLLLHCASKKLVV